MYKYCMVIFFLNTSKKSTSFSDFELLWHYIFQKNYA